jgi:uncharacterized protein (TIGR03083 family)
VERLDALHASVDHLTVLVAGLDEPAMERSAYPEQWTIADVMAHVGSGAVIMARRVEDSLRGEAVPDDFPAGVWARWDGKSPRARVEDGLDADRAFLHRLESLTDDERDGLRVPLGPMTVGFDEIVGVRVNEHVLHTWDIEVALTPGAKLLPAALPQVVDNLELIARFTACPTGTQRTIRIRTSGPERRFRIDLRPDGVELAHDDGRVAPDLELPAEAFVRLVYGRLDPERAPSNGIGAEELDELRRVYPGP